MHPALPDLHRAAVRRRGEKVLGAAAVGAAVAALVLGLLVAPPDAVQGQAQRLMYVHVPAAWTGFLSVGVVALASLVVLLGGGRLWSSLGRAAGELAVGMLALAYAEGSVWGHASWGVWWTWDPRLVTTAVLLLTCVGYVATSALGREAPDGDTRRSDRRTALVGLLAAAEVPVVHLSVLWWRSIHQPPTLLRPSLSAPINATMLLALLVAVAAFTLAGAWYVARRLAQQLPARPEPELAASPGARPAAAAPDQLAGERPAQGAGR
ncbi:MAG TPA: cytochrome c biogenesis protein CcsA [Marmoricola sp.]|nr:cytochrome c biogenesis protein CcsA [Marmoricola sp.]